MYKKSLLFSFLCSLLSTSSFLFGMQNPLITPVTFYIKNNDGFHVFNEQNQLEKLNNFTIPSLKYESVTLDSPSSESLGACILATPKDIIAYINPLTDEQVIALRHGLAKQEGNRKMLFAKIDLYDAYVHIKAVNLHTINSPRQDIEKPQTLSFYAKADDQYYHIDSQGFCKSSQNISLDQLIDNAYLSYNNDTCTYSIKDPSTTIADLGMLNDELVQELKVIITKNYYLYIQLTHNTCARVTAIESSHLPDLEPEPDSGTELPDISNNKCHVYRIEDEKYISIKTSGDLFTLSETSSGSNSNTDEQKTIKIKITKASDSESGSDTNPDMPPSKIIATEKIDALLDTAAQTSKKETRKKQEINIKEIYKSLEKEIESDQQKQKLKTTDQQASITPHQPETQTPTTTVQTQPIEIQQQQQQPTSIIPKQPETQTPIITVQIQPTKTKDKSSNPPKISSSYTKPFFIITGLTLAGFIAAYLLYPDKVLQFLQSLRDTLTNKFTAHNV